MNGAKVGILEEGDEVSFDGFLKCTDGRALETKIRLEVLSDLTNETLEGEFADEQLSRLLVTTDFTKSDGTLKMLITMIQLVIDDQTYQACIDEAS